MHMTYSYPECLDSQSRVGVQLCLSACESLPRTLKKEKQLLKIEQHIFWFHKYIVFIGSYCSKVDMVNIFLKCVYKIKM